MRKLVSLLVHVTNVMIESKVIIYCSFIVKPCGIRILEWRNP
jgi:hypothetical protein